VVKWDGRADFERLKRMGAGVWRTKVMNGLEFELEGL
jgi:hypothetical protein